MTQMRREEERAKRRARWRRFVEKWNGSGLSQAEFCRRNGLKAADFSWWKHELARHGDAEAEAKCEALPAFVPLRIKPPTLQGEVEIRLLNGRCVCASLACDPAVLARLAAALEAGC